MTSIRAAMEELIKQASEYINLKVDLLKLKAAEAGSRILSAIISVAILSVIFLLSLIFASTALAFAIAGWLKSNAAGFLVVAGLYLLIGMIVWLARERLIRVPIMNQIIAQLFRKKEEEK